MRIAISNIAWDVSEDEQVANLLAEYDVDAVDIAPGKYFADPAMANDEDIAKVKAYWQGKGIELTGMQSLLFGTEGMNVFGAEGSQQAMLKHIDSVCRVASGLGARRLVFGSPKNRDREGFSDERALSIAISFFNRLGDIAKQHGVFICLEPNPRCYGANFMTSSLETYQLVSAINHSAIKMQLDTGAITINMESITEVLAYANDKIGHIHISDANLAAVGLASKGHVSYAKAITAFIADPLVCIEMVATKDEPHIVSIERALKFVHSTYLKPACIG